MNRDWNEVSKNMKLSREWEKQHIHEDIYKNKWIALKGTEVLGSGYSLAELIDNIGAENYYNVSNYITRGIWEVHENKYIKLWKFFFGG